VAALVHEAHCGSVEKEEGVLRGSPWVRKGGTVVESGQR
jgi:hypothetical protein